MSKSSMSPSLLLANFALLSLTIGSNYVLVPLNANLICTSFLVVYLGCHRSLNGAGEGEERKAMETMDRKDALWFPITAGITLCSLFVLFKFFDKDWVNFVLSAYIGLVSVFVCANEVKALVRLVVKSTNAPIDVEFWVPFAARLFGAQPAATKNAGASTAVVKPAGDVFFVTEDNRVVVKISWGGIVSLVLGAAVTAWYMKSRHWIANNLIGIAMSLQAMESLSVGSFKTGCVLLSILFFYDIFFVFGTDVMVTVAKSVDGPIKLLFLKAFAQEDADAQFSMLGLGDIVLPGIFVALLLRFDAKQAKLDLGKLDHSSTSFPKPIFNFAVFCYALGLWATVAVMHVFKHPQPALLYLVPAVLFAGFAGGLATKQMKALWDFEETEPVVAAEKLEKKE